MSETKTAGPTGEQQASSSDEAARRDRPASAPGEHADNEAFHTAVAGLQEALVTEMSAVVGRVITSTLTETDAFVRRARAEARKALEEALADLASQTREKEMLAQSLQDAQREVTTLRLELGAERERANAARDECQALQGTRARAEEAETARQEIVASYETQLRALRGELDKQSAERAKLLAVLETVQQTVSASGSDRSASSERRTTPDRATADSTRSGRNQAKAAPPASAGQAPKHDAPVPAAVAQPVPSSAPAPDGPGTVRGLKLVPSSQQTPIDAPRELLEHVRHLLDEIETMYCADAESAERPADVVERLTVNLRYAWDLFTRRIPSDGGASAAVFEQQLSLLLDAKSATTFGRHLSIAAHQIVARTEGTAPPDRAVAVS